VRRILLVDDDVGVRMSYAALLEDEGFVVVEAVSLAESREQMAGPAFDAALVDLHLGDGLGTALAADLRARHPRAAFVLLSGADAPAGSDVDLVLPKGSAPSELAAVIERAIARRADDT
jgi:DNA-binding NarL/FixJ family response regulator